MSLTRPSNKVAIQSNQNMCRSPVLQMSKPVDRVVIGHLHWGFDGESPIFLTRGCRFSPLHRQIFQDRVVIVQSGKVFNRYRH